MAKRISNYTKTVKCHESHKPLAFTVGGTEYAIHGGSCTCFVSTDYDVIVGLDHGMQSISMDFPWEPGTSFLYPIKDCHPPSNVKTFTKLIGWLAERVLAGDKVFVGCIGGHGRTGTVLAALMAHLNVTDDPISYVRDNYCHKAVEVSTQVDFLVKHFGAKQVAGSKGLGWKPSGGSGGKYGGILNQSSGGAGTFQALPSPCCVFGLTTG